jgi:hypothetical protein
MTLHIPVSPEPSTLACPEGNRRLLACFHLQISPCLAEKLMQRIEVRRYASADRLSQAGSHNPARRLQDLLPTLIYNGIC